MSGDEKEKNVQFLTKLFEWLFKIAYFTNKECIPSCNTQINYEKNVYLWSCLENVFVLLIRLFDTTVTIHLLFYDNPKGFIE